jgi:DnaJ like chaperone protein
MDNLHKTPAKKPFPAAWQGPLLGALGGILGGGASAGIVGGGTPAGLAAGGALAGALLGALLQQLILRYRFHKKVARYFEEPGKVGFDEGAAGLSAYCALGIILVVLSVRTAEPNPLFGHKPAGEAGEKAPDAGSGKSGEEKLIAGRVIQSAQEAFPGNAPASALMKAFCRTALSMTDRLNPDLLAESLAARRAAAGDLDRLGRELESLAQGDRALQEAASIRRTLSQGAYRKPTGKAEGQEPR